MSLSVNGGVPLYGTTPVSTNGYNPFNPANNRLVSARYDAAGSQTEVGSYSLAYDAENRQTIAVDNVSEGQASYGYDGLGQRVTKSNNGVIGTLYVYDIFGQVAAEYNSFGKQQSPCSTCYLSYDQLGSVRLVTDNSTSANIISRHDYLPFGEEIPANTAGRRSEWGPFGDTVDQKFTGQERDRETGFDFFQARYFYAAQGRFNSPDPANARADLTNPQSWNAYSYVLNNPLSLVDPSGLDIGFPGPCEDPEDPECGGGPPPIPPCFFFDCGGSGGSSGQGQTPLPPPTTTPPNANQSGVYAQSQTGSFPPGSFPGGENLGLPPGMTIPGPLSWQVLLGLDGWDCSSGVCVPGFFGDSYQPLLSGQSRSGSYWGYAACLTFTALPRALFTGATGIGGIAILGKSFSERFVPPPGVLRKVPERAATTG